MQGGQELAALAPTSAACAWMVVVDSSTMMLPSASKVMPGAVCTSGGREGSRRSAPSLPLTFSCTQGTRLAPTLADRSPEQAAMLRCATDIAGRAWREWLHSIMIGQAQAGAQGRVQKEGHMLVQGRALQKAACRRQASPAAQQKRVAGFWQVAQAAIIRLAAQHM